MSSSDLGNRPREAYRKDGSFGAAALLGRTVPSRAIQTPRSGGGKVRLWVKPLTRIPSSPPSSRCARPIRQSVQECLPLPPLAGVFGWDPRLLYVQYLAHDHHQNFNFLFLLRLAPQPLRQLYRVSRSSPLVDRYSLRSPWFHFQSR